MNGVELTVAVIPWPVLPCGAVLGYAIARLLIETARVLCRRRQDRRLVAARLASIPLLRDDRPRTLAGAYAAYVPDWEPDEDPDELSLPERQ